MEPGADDDVQADEELEAIRQRRMAELMARQGGDGGSSEQNQQEQEKQRQEAEERRKMMLQQVMEMEARERLSRIKLVKPDKAKAVEDLILQMATRRQLQERVNEERLIHLLEQVNTQMSQNTRVTIQRQRKSVLEDDW